MRSLLIFAALVLSLVKASAAQDAVDTVHDMPTDKAILIYEDAEKGGLSVSVVKQDGVKRVALAASEVVVDRFVGRLLASLRPDHLVISSPSDFPEFDAGAAHHLFKLLVQPLMKDLSGIDRLAIIADGMLGELPFDTLLTTMPSSDLRKAEAYAAYPWLRKTFAISRITRSVRRVGGNDDVSRRDGGLLGFGNPALDQSMVMPMPALPEANLELASLRMSLHGRPGKIAVGQGASEARFKEALTAGDDLAVLALATHGYRADGAMDDAFLMLAEGDGEDGILSASEIRALRFRADLVILSACHSGAGTMADAFIEAGGDRVLALRWAVLSDVARQVSVSLVAMTQRDADLPYDLALSQVVDQLIGGTSSHYSHPMVWAPFVLTTVQA